MGNPSDQEQLSSPVPNQEDQVAVLLQNAFLPPPPKRFPLFPFSKQAWSPEQHHGAAAEDGDRPGWCLEPFSPL